LHVVLGVIGVLVAWRVVVSVVLPLVASYHQLVSALAVK